MSLDAVDSHVTALIRLEYETSEPQCRHIKYPVSTIKTLCLREKSFLFLLKSLISRI